MPMTAQVLNLEDGDKVVLQYLGAATVLQWDSLPKQVQDLILQQADAVGGLPPVTSLHDQIKLLLRRDRG
jgi:hypothetical protein